MTIRSLGALVPRVAVSAWVSEAAYVVGDVEIGEDSSIWPGAVIRGDFGPIVIGSRTHIEDGCILHAGRAMTVGSNVLVGHGALVHCGSVGDNCLVGSRSIVLDHVQVGAFTTIAAGSVVLTGTEIPERSFVVGSPATVRPASEKQLDFLHRMAASDGGYIELYRRYRDAGL